MSKKISTRGIKPEKQLFHNQSLDVYPKRIKFEDIVFWPENARTELAFDILEAEKERPLSKIQLSEITDFLVQRPEMELFDLAGSIERNGVRVPLIVLDDGTLLDGNRRFFACSYLYHRREPKPDVLNKIPVWVIKKNKTDKRIRFKIVAEANYVRDFKVEWPLDVKAGVIYDFFQNCKKSGMDEPGIYTEIKDVFSEDRTQVDAYIETVNLTKEFVQSAGQDKRNDFREQVQGKFLYFWEFRNKAMRGRAALDTKELSKVKTLFFKMIETDRFKNFKQVEPMIRAVRDEYSWELLVSTQGDAIDQVEALYKEQRAIRSADDKIRNFLRWLQGVKPESLSKPAIKLLEEVVAASAKIIGKSK